jgi:hypothetical protein
MSSPTTNGGKDEPNIAGMQKWQGTSQRTLNIKTYDRTKCNHVIIAKRLQQGYHFH